MDMGRKKVLYVSLLLLQLVAVDAQLPERTDQTVYILKGAESVELSCGQVPDTAMGIEWKMFDATTRDFKTIFKLNHTISGKTPRNRNDNTEEKYLISASVNTSLVVKDISLSDTGLFSCVSIGGHDDNEHNVMLQVVVPPTDDSVVTLSRGDIRTRHQADLKGPYLENESENFTCYIGDVVPGMESTAFKYYYNGHERLNSKDDVGEVIESEDVLGNKFVQWRFSTSFNRTDNGKSMRCIVNWKAGQYKKDNLASETTTEVLVYYPPDVKVGGTTSPVSEYTTTDLDCITTGGNPSSPGEYNYTWTYNSTYTESNTDLPVPTGSVILNGGQMLQLKDLGYEKIAGTYKCTVTSIGGQNSGTSILIVYYPAKSENGPEDMTVFAAIDTAVNLTMKFHMNPVTDYRIEWYMGGTTVPEANLTNIVNGESVEVVYFIPNVNRKSLGYHTVRVINNAMKGGTNGATFVLTLTLSGPPEKPREVRVREGDSVCFNATIDISWEAGLNCGSEQFFIVQHHQKGQENYMNSTEIQGLKTGELHNYTIKELEQNRRYYVRVVSVNGYGETSSDIQDVITAVDLCLDAISTALSLVIVFESAIGMWVIGYLYRGRLRDVKEERARLAKLLRKAVENKKKVPVVQAMLELESRLANRRRQDIANPQAPDIAEVDEDVPLQDENSSLTYVATTIEMQTVQVE